jgi:hypothetical protein
VRNPEQAAAGVFDVGFAVIFLLPMLCVTPCHDLAMQGRRYFYRYVFEERPMGAMDFAPMPSPRPAPSQVRHAGFAWLGLSLSFAVGLIALLRRLAGRASA